MFELSVACKYLIPRWRQLSVSIISIVSALVVALVVWLIVVFFSVKDGLESSWIEKLIALTAPVRITPTEKYYKSYYYLADSISSKSEYTLKSIGEKLEAEASDPYDPHADEELPEDWLSLDRDAEGNLKDLAKLAYATAAGLPQAQNPKASVFEVTAANLRLRMLRPYFSDQLDSSSSQGQTEQFIDQVAYIGTYDADVPAIAKILLPLSSADLNNIVHAEGFHTTSGKTAEAGTGNPSKRLKNVFSSITITALKTPSQGWIIPRTLLPDNIELGVCAVLKNGRIVRIIVPASLLGLDSLIHRYREDGLSVVKADLRIDNAIAMVQTGPNNYYPITPSTPIQIDGGVLLNAALLQSSLEHASMLKHIRFKIEMILQGYNIIGNVELGPLEVASAQVKDGSTPLPFAIKAPDSSKIIVGSGEEGEPILIPRSFKEGGVLVGDYGYLSYQSATPSSIQEQRIPVYVAGFYDPGIMPIGGKFILASHQVTDAIHAAQNHDEALFTNGINMRFDNLGDAQKIKNALIAAFEQLGIDPYWKVETYQEYEFTKDLIQQLQSEKNLFSLISIVIIIVACSNIISMLIILVNDKKLEIGILRSMGASSFSIAAIFGLCGMVMGAIGSVIGIIAAVLTLYYLDFLVGWLGRMQGHELFNPLFYGNILPNTISLEALGLVVAATALVSLLAGIIPAVKASTLSPSSTLRSE